MTGITTHVLDLGTGTPATGIGVRLERHAGGSWQTVAEATTDADGRVRDAFAAMHDAGRYRLTFASGAYFAARGATSFHPEIAVVFEIREAGRHHHVPLLLSAFGYSTYRGS